MTFSRAARRKTVTYLSLAVAVTSLVLIYQAWTVVRHAAASNAAGVNLTENLGAAHSQRLETAAARAAMDVLGMTNGAQDAAAYQVYRTDYRVERMQMQADWEGLENWAAEDPGAGPRTGARRQVLLPEVRASHAALLLALDYADPTLASRPNGLRLPALLPALSRFQNALRSYSAMLSQGSSGADANLRRVLAASRWVQWLVFLLLAEITVLVRVVLPALW